MSHNSLKSRLPQNVHRLHLYVSALFCLILSGTIAYQLLEGWSMLDSFYFSIVTLATVGYGDHYPVTTRGKLFTTGYISVGVLTFLLFVNELSRWIHKDK